MLLEAVSCWLGVPLFVEVLVFREKKKPKQNTGLAQPPCNQGYEQCSTQTFFKKVLQHFIVP